MNAAVITLKHIRQRLKRRLCSRSGVLARRVHHPNPFAAPWRRKSLDIDRSGGLGDVLMCTPALREVKRLNPDCALRVYTDYPELLKDLPYIDEVHPHKEVPKGAVYMRYEDSGLPRSPLPMLMADSIGVGIDDIRLDCTIDAGLVEAYENEWRPLPRPHVIVLRRASRWTPNKDWPDRYWEKLVQAVCGFGTVIEIGVAPEQDTPVPPGSYRDLRGRTSIAQLAAIVAAGDIYVGPVSGPAHIAAAAGTRAVVIYGGYEHPRGLPYEGQIPFYTAVPCAPCWLPADCRFDRKCLTAILPARIEQAIRQVWGEIESAGSGPVANAQAQDTFFKHAAG